MDKASLLDSLGRISTLSQPQRDLRLVVGQVLSQCYCFV